MKRLWRTIVWRILAAQIKHAFFFGFKAAWENKDTLPDNESLAITCCEDSWKIWYNFYWNKYNHGGGDLR